MTIYIMRKKKFVAYLKYYLCIYVEELKKIRIKVMISGA
jgi:hypothetical protein